MRRFFFFDFICLFNQLLFFFPLPLLSFIFFFFLHFFLFLSFAFLFPLFSLWSSFFFFRFLLYFIHRMRMYPHMLSFFVFRSSYFFFVFFIFCPSLCFSSSASFSFSFSSSSSSFFSQLLGEPHAVPVSFLFSSHFLPLQAPSSFSFHRLQTSAFSRPE